MDEACPEIVASKIQNAFISSVNYAEVVAVLSRKMALTKITAILEKLIKEIIQFDPSDAVSIGLLYNKTMRYGLSLGDRACIALSMKLNLEIYTADKV
jgi:PIN domain nuclease of toxin-antitoxin system